jgi:hypothetical protein
MFKRLNFWLKLRKNDCKACCLGCEFFNVCYDEQISAQMEGIE